MSFFWGVILFLAIGAKTYAQDEVPKELLLSSLNAVVKLKLDNEQITALIEYNKGFVDEVYEVLESKQDDKDKKKSMKALSENREKDLRKILGRKKTKKYLKLMEEELKPLTKKNKLLKPIIQP